jgi:superfamily II DNA or RNA helicase
MGKFAPGDVVIRTGAAGEMGVVSGPGTPYGGVTWYTVRFATGTSQVSEDALSPFVKDAHPLDTVPLSPEALRRVVLTRKVSMGLGDMLYSLAASKTVLHPYQYKPLIKLLESGWRRVLVADEVGLGKTIEAGFVTLERIARKPESRVLIVCPAILRKKWKNEFEARFDLRFRTPDRDELIRRVARGDDSPEDPPLRLIVSYEQIRSEAFTDALEPQHAGLDLLIVDEAHRARKRQSLQSAAVSQLAQLAEWVMLLTATPIMTSEQDLFTLLQLLVEAQFPTFDVYTQRAALNRHVVAAERAVQLGTLEGLKSAQECLDTVERADRLRLVAGQSAYGNARSGIARLIDDFADVDVHERLERFLDLQAQLFEVNMLSPFFNRTRRRDVHTTFARRKVITAGVTATEAEYAAIERLSDAIFQEYERRMGSWPATLTLSTYRAQLASSVSGCVRHLKQFIGTRFQFSESDAAAVASVIGEKYVELPQDECLPESVAGVLASLDPNVLEAQDSKWSVLKGVLDGSYNVPGDPVIGKVVVFAFYKPSLDVIERHLTREGVRYVRIDGDVESEERASRVSAFERDPGIRVLLASQVGGEGIDLQCANAVVNWDLPWNPMQVEQRIGRVDRIGQASSVIYVVNIVLSGTIEDRIVARLHQRIQDFVANIGNLEEILGPLMGKLEGRVLSVRMTEAEMSDECERLIAVAKKQAKDQGLVESKVDEFLGQEQFLTDRVGALKAEGRYVSGAELLQFVEERLAVADPESFVRKLPDSDLYELGLGPRMKGDVRKCMPRNNSDWNAFLRRCDKGVLRACFPLEQKQAPQEAELLSVNHPLVRTLVQLGPTSSEVCLHCDGTISGIDVPLGQYLLIAAIHSSHNSQHPSSLISACVSMPDGRALHHRESDALLTAFLERGTAVQTQLSLDVRKAAYARCQAVLAGRVAEWEAKREQRAEDARRRTLAIIEADFGQQIAAVSASIAHAESAGVESGVRRMLPIYRSKLQKLEATRDMRLSRDGAHIKPEWRNQELATVVIGVI